MLLYVFSSATPSISHDLNHRDKSKMSTENKRDERQSHREANKEREEQEGRVNNVPQLQDAAKEQAPDGAAKGLDTEDASLALEEEARVQAQRDIERARAKIRQDHGERSAAHRSPMSAHGLGMDWAWIGHGWSVPSV